MNFTKKISYVLIVITNVYLYYYSYRYILKYNSTTTSPTYSDTPTIFKLAKYLIIILLLIIFILYAIKKKIKIRGKKMLTLAVMLILIVQELYCFIVARGSDQLMFAICLLPPFLMILFNSKIDAKMLDKTFEIFVYIALAYEFVQIILYITTGRLPALAYDTGVITDVRFGSVWDDPNGFGIFLLFLIPYSVLKFKGLKKIFITIALIGMLALTWSLTAFLSAIIVGILSISISILKDTKRNFIVYLITIIVIIIGFIACLLKIDSIVTLYENKIGSISEHLESFRFENFTIYQLLGVIPSGADMESGAVRLIYIGGVIHFILFYVLSIFSLVKLRMISKNSNYSRIYLPAFWFMIAFLIASFNLPTMYNFSLFGIYCIFLGIAFKPLEEKSLLKEGEKIYG